MVTVAGQTALVVTFAGSGDAFGSGGRYQACIHLRGPGGYDPVLLDCGATSRRSPSPSSREPRWAAPAGSKCT